MIMKMITDIIKEEKKKKRKEKRKKNDQWKTVSTFIKKRRKTLRSSSWLHFLTKGTVELSRRKDHYLRLLIRDWVIVINQVDWSTCRLIFVAFQAYVTVNLSFSHPETSWVISVNWQILGQSIWTKQWKTRQKIRLNMIRK